MKKRRTQRRGGVPDTKQIGQKSRDGRTGGRGKQPPHAMHNIVYKVHTPFKPLPMRVLAAGRYRQTGMFPVATRMAGAQRIIRRAKEQERRKIEKKIFGSTDPAASSARPRPQDPSHGPAKTRSQGPIPLSGRPLANPPQKSEARHRSLRCCIVHMYNTYCNNGKAGPVGHPPHTKSAGPSKQASPPALPAPGRIQVGRCRSITA